MDLSTSGISQSFPCITPVKSLWNLSSETSLTWFPLSTSMHLRYRLSFSCLAVNDLITIAMSFDIPTLVNVAKDSSVWKNKTRTSLNTPSNIKSEFQNSLNSDWNVLLSSASNGNNEDAALSTLIWNIQIKSVFADPGICDKKSLYPSTPFNLVEISFILIVSANTTVQFISRLNIMPYELLIPGGKYFWFLKSFKGASPSDAIVTVLEGASKYSGLKNTSNK